jgi:hypothetical protein
MTARRHAHFEASTPRRGAAARAPAWILVAICVALADSGVRTCARRAPHASLRGGRHVRALEGTAIDAFAGRFIAGAKAPPPR